MNMNLLLVAARLASVVGLFIAAPAHAVDCMNLGPAPLAATPIYGEVTTGSNSTYSRSDCFTFSTDGGELAITGMNSVDVKWLGSLTVVDIRNLAIIDSLALRDADGLVIVPLDVEEHVGTFATPQGFVPYLAGNTWNYGALAPGVYQLNTEIGWNYSDGTGSSAYTLAITAVPEAASAAMLSLGLALLACTLGRGAGTAGARLGHRRGHPC